MNNCIERSIAVLMLLALTGCASWSPGTAPSLPQPPAAATPAPASPQPDAEAQKRYSLLIEHWQRNEIADVQSGLKALSVEHPRYAGPWTSLGILHARANRPAQAIAALRHATVLNPRNGIAYNWLGILYREQGDHAHARQMYLQALEIDPDHALAHYNLAILLDVHLRQPLEALPHYRAYDRLSGQTNLKVASWIAQIEARHATATAALASATVLRP